MFLFITLFSTNNFCFLVEFIFYKEKLSIFLFFLLWEKRKIHIPQKNIIKIFLIFTCVSVLYGKNQMKIFLFPDFINFEENSAPF